MRGRTASKRCLIESDSLASSSADNSSGRVSTVRNTEQQVIITELSTRIPNSSKQAEAEVLNDLLSLFGRRQVILHLLRRDMQIRGLLKIWLYFHVPLTIALLVALTIHIFSVFIYW